jgi:uncharacterized peroxidase-related enzyme
MSFVGPAPDSPETTELYQQDEAAIGYVANYTRAFAWRPQVYRAWRELNGSIKAGMDLRRYELATLAAARQLRSSYCALAHGKVLRDQFLPAERVRDAAVDYHAAGLDPVDVAIMDFADKVAGGAANVTADDVAELRRHGLSAQEIVDVALAASARCFFSNVLEALGVLPDSQYASSLEPDLRRALTVGRPIEGA